MKVRPSLTQERFFHYPIYTKKYQKLIEHCMIYTANKLGECVNIKLNEPSQKFKGKRLTHDQKMAVGKYMFSLRKTAVKIDKFNVRCAMSAIVKMFVNPDTQALSCKACTSAFATKSGLIEHVRRVHTKLSEARMCNWCPATLHCIGMVKHIRSKHPDKFYKFGGEALEKRLTLANWVHQSMKIGDPNLTLTRVRYNGQCTHCDFFETDVKKMRAHQLSKHGFNSSMQTCFLCGKHNNGQAILRHFQKDHRKEYKEFEVAKALKSVTGFPGWFAAMAKGKIIFIIHIQYI